MKYLWGVVHALRVNLLLITTFSLWLWRWPSVLSEVAAAATADHHHVHSCLGPGFNQHASRWENGGFLSHRGTPNSWMVYRFISWKIDRKKWMIWGSPIFRKPPMVKMMVNHKNLVYFDWQDDDELHGFCFFAAIGTAWPTCLWGTRTHMLVSQREWSQNQVVRM